MISVSVQHLIFDVIAACCTYISSEIKGGGGLKLVGSPCPVVWNIDSIYLFLLSSLLLKVCQSLKSRVHDVREIARDTLLKMAQALGSRFLQYIISEMKGSLTRGYQVYK